MPSIHRAIVFAVTAILTSSIGGHLVLLAQAPPLYGDRWANSPWHSAYPFQFRWVTEGPGVYSYCTVQLRSVDSGEHVSDFEVEFTNGARGDFQTGTVEDLGIGPRGLSSITNIGALSGYGCKEVLDVTPINVR